MGGFLCDDIVKMKISCNLILDLTLIKKNHTLNCCSFLLKLKLTNSMLVTVMAQFIVKTANSEKAICFLSVSSCSINLLKSHMLFTRKSFMYLDFTSKKKFAPGNDWGAPLPPPPFSAALKKNYNGLKPY